MAPLGSLVVLALARTTVGVTTGQALSLRASANPIRKVVNLLQKMQKKVEDEGAKADELFERYICYCRSGGADLAASIESADMKVPELQAGIKEGAGKEAQLKKAVADKETDRVAAKKALAEATALRGKEKATYDAELAENKANLKALRSAVASISKGMGQSFLQTRAASTLRQYVGEAQFLMDSDRDMIFSFLSGKGGAEYAPASGEILGILKQIGDEMEKAQKDLIDTENTAVGDYEALAAAKKQEVSVLSRAIEDNLNRVSEVGVELAMKKNDLEDTSEALAEDSKFVADLDKECEKRKKTHQGEKDMRAQEVLAIAETIKVLNDDDALDLFKKTLPSDSSATSFMQVQVTFKSMRARAHAILKAARNRHAEGQDRHRLDFIALALQGKKAGFDEVTKMVDGLIATHHTEQDQDDQKKAYCEKEADVSDDKHKALERKSSDAQTVIDEGKEGIQSLASEIEALKTGIIALDKSVKTATSQRKEENAAYKELMQSNQASKELILFAKNRLNKFYNKALYKPPPKRELSEEDRLYSNQGGELAPEEAGGIAGTGIQAFVQVSSKLRRGAPPPPPEVAAAYTKKTEDSGGVMALMDLLVADIDKEVATAEVEEKNSQEEYEQMMADSASKRAKDSKAMTDKEGNKAEMEAALQGSAGDKKSADKELEAVKKYIVSLHGECDWVVDHYGMRKEARADDVDSLQKAKAVLNGADYSFLQRQSLRLRKFLHRV